MLPADPQMPTVNLRQPRLVDPQATGDYAETPTQDTTSSNDRPSEALPPGTRYHLGEIIAAGGMGQVLHAIDRVLSRAVAVKVIRPELLDRPHVLRRFADEARIAGRLQHPGVPPVYDLGTLADGRPFLAMKLIEGRTFSDLLRDRHDSAADRTGHLHVFEQICQTMAYAHDHGVIHRDLKPSNVMVGAFGEVQVMDWGLAKVLAIRENAENPFAETGGSPEPPADAEGSSNFATQAGSILGTLLYMSPEQARGEANLDARSDVYALGSILCEILTGHPAFPTVSHPLQLAREQTQTAEVQARLAASGADPDLIALAMHCLAPNRDDRPSDAGAVAAALAAHRVGVESRLRTAEHERVAAEASAASDRRRQRLRLWLIGSALLLLSVLAGAAWIIDRQHQASLAEQTRHRQEQEQEARLTRTAVTTTLDRVEHHLRQDRLDLAATGISEAASRLGEDAPDDLLQRCSALERHLNMARDLEKIHDEHFTISSHRGGSLRRTVQRFAERFKVYGLELGSAGVTQVRDAPIAEQLARGLEGWLSLLPISEEYQPTRAQLVELLNRVDGDIDRQRVRLIFRDQHWVQLQREVARYQPKTTSARFTLLMANCSALRVEDRLRLLRESRNVAPQEPMLALELAELLADEKDPALVAEREGCLRSVLAVRPESISALNNLSNLLAERKAPGALELMDRAIAVAPRDARLHFNRALLLRGRGDLPGTVAGLRDASRFCAPDQKELTARLADALGDVLAAQGDLPAAKTAYEDALRADPTAADAYNGLALLLERNDVPAAIRVYRQGIQQAPKDAALHANLAAAIKKSGDLPGSLPLYRRAIELNDRDARIHYNFGLALRASGNVDEAIESFRSATQLDPQMSQAFDDLARALAVRGDLDGAETAFRAAVAIDGRNTRTLVALGSVLRHKGDLAGAMTFHRAALAVNPDEPEALCNLGLCLSVQGEFAEAVRLLERGHTLGSRQPGWRHPSAALLKMVKRRAELDLRLPRLLEGAEDVATPKELAEFATLCTTCRGYHREAIEYYRRAFAEAPDLESELDSFRYGAVLAALQAALGAGQIPVPAEERPALRAQALRWMQDELSGFKEQPPQTRSAILGNWLREPGFASIRDEVALKRLPDTERAAWEQFWAAVRQAR